MLWNPDPSQLPLSPVLQLSRRDCHMYVLTRARGLLLDFVRQLASRQRAAAAAAAAAAAGNDARGAAQAARDEEEVQGRLEALLTASFAYLSIPELKQVVGRGGGRLGCFGFW